MALIITHIIVSCICLMGTYMANPNWCLRYNYFNIAHDIWKIHHHWWDAAVIHTCVDAKGLPIQGSFWVRAQSMKDDVAMYRCLWLTAPIPRIIPVIEVKSRNNSIDIISTRYDFCCAVVINLSEHALCLLYEEYIWMRNINAVDTRRLEQNDRIFLMTFSNAFLCTKLFVCFIDKISSDYISKVWLTIT